MRGKQRNLWVVILAGGDGRRLGALTANAEGVCTPKQFCSLNGGPSLLQLSIRRALRLVPRQRIALIVTEAHRRWWEPALWALRRSGLVVQPSNRGTGLGVLLPLLVIARSDPNAGVICLPSDHYVENEEVVVESMQQATTSDALNCDKLTLLGMSPNAPDSGFGYVTPAAADSRVGMRPVQSFFEKPDTELAAQLIGAGSVWNTGIFAGLARTVLELYSQQVPRLLQNLGSIVSDWPDSTVPSAELVSLYARHPTVDFSREVLQRQPTRLQVLTVPSCGWNDVGTPARLATTLWALRSKGERATAPKSPVNALNLSTAFVAMRVANRSRFAPEVLQE